MTTLGLPNNATVPEESQVLLDQLEKSLGMVPNFHAMISVSPQALKGYMTLHQLATESAFNEDEVTVVWQTINVEHACHYCVPAHTAVAKGMGVDDSISQALRDETPLPSEKLEALRQFTLMVVRNRGNVPEVDINAFKATGFTDRSITDIVLILSQKVMSNYLNHMADTPVDDAFSDFSWTKKEA
jgi:alkylhydroperoxidase family enzyme